MKKSTIIAIVFIAVCIAALISTLSDSGKMGNFSEAFAAPDREFRVSGTLDRSAEVEYDALTDASLTMFNMRDQNGVVQRVHLKKSKPMGFEQSESLVLIGHAAGDVFVAKDMLMKCPSKYNEENHKIQEASL